MMHVGGNFKKLKWWIAILWKVELQYIETYLTNFDEIW